MQSPLPAYGMTAEIADVEAYLRKIWGHGMYYEIKQKLCVVCYRISDNPTPKVASRQQQCACCCAAIWVARKSPAAPPKICVQCVQNDVSAAATLN